MTWIIWYKKKGVTYDLRYDGNSLTDILRSFKRDTGCEEKDITRINKE